MRNAGPDAQADAGIMREQFDAEINKTLNPSGFLDRWEGKEREGREGG